MAGSNGDHGNGHLSPFDARRRARRRRRERRRRSRTGRRAALAAVLVVMLGGVAAVAAGAFTTVEGFKNSCTLAALDQIEIGQNSFVYAADGSFLGTIEAEKNRQPLTIEQMGAWLPQATVAIEDRRFYEHGGARLQGRPAGRRRERQGAGSRPGRLDDHACSSSATSTSRWAPSGRSSAS